MVGMIFGIILLVVGVVVGIITATKYEEENVTNERGNYIRDAQGNYVTKKEYLYKKYSWICIVGGIVLCVVLTFLGCIATVETGHTGVVTTFGRVEDYTLDAGFHMKAPWQSLIKMDNRVQKATIDLSCFSQDIQEVECKYTLNYQISKKDAQTIYRTIGKDYYDTVITPNVAESVKTIMARYTAENLVGNRDSLALEIEALLGTQLEKYNIEVVSTAIEDMDFTDEFTTAVEAKQVAVQNKLKAATEQEQKTMEAQQAAERAKIQANADAEVAKIQAQADMEVAKIGADSAEYQGKREAAVYMRKLGALNGWSVIETINDNGEASFKFLDSEGNLVSKDEVIKGTQTLIKQEYINKWNGILPQYYFGDDSSIIIDLNN